MQTICVRKVHSEKVSCDCGGDRRDRKHLVTASMTVISVGRLKTNNYESLDIALCIPSEKPQGRKSDSRRCKCVDLQNVYCNNCLFRESSFQISLRILKYRMFNDSTSETCSRRGLCTSQRPIDRGRIMIMQEDTKNTLRANCCPSASYNSFECQSSSNLLQHQHLQSKPKNHHSSPIEMIIGIYILNPATFSYLRQLELRNVYCFIAHANLFGLLKRSYLIVVKDLLDTTACEQIGTKAGTAAMRMINTTRISQFHCTLQTTTLPTTTCHVPV